MALKDVFKISRKTFINPSAWLGYNELKNNTQSIWAILRSLFTPPKLERTETFEEAKQRLNLTEEDIQKKMQIYFAYAIAFVILAGCAFIASFYYLIHHETVSGWLLAMSVSAFLLAQAFRYHFWYFQMKHRKLGCTFIEWRQGKLSDEEPKA